MKITRTTTIRTVRFNDLKVGDPFWTGTGVAVKIGPQSAIRVGVGARTGYIAPDEAVTLIQEIRVKV